MSKKLEKIYEEIAEKSYRTYYECPHCKEELEDDDYGLLCNNCDYLFEEDGKAQKGDPDAIKKKEEHGDKTVMIGDVLDWKKKEIDNHKGQHHGHELQCLCKNLTIFWGELRKPIEEQSKECIDFINSIL